METAASSWERRRYSAAEKAVAVRDSVTLGFRGAGRHYGIPESMIMNWARRAEGQGSARPVEAPKEAPSSTS